MAMLTMTSTSNNSLRDASFSSYLSSSEENFVRKLAESSRNLSPVLTAQEEKYSLGEKKEDGEIGVFSAEKYFNGVMDDNSPRITKVASLRKSGHPKDEKTDPPPVKTRIQPGTPSIRSESSWNSQNALLQSVLKNPSRKKAQRVQGKGFFAGLRCRCSCSDKDSVDINESVTGNSFRRSAAAQKEPVRAAANLIEGEKPDLGLMGRENCFSFPTTNPEVGNLPIGLNFQAVEDEKPRKSIEVFGCSPLEKITNNSSNNKSSSVLPWDASIPSIGNDEFLATPPPGENYNDTESDASSDLFEIESLTGKSNPFLVRQGSDVTSVAGYAPSEASIEWSVVTASAADYSVMSDCEEVMPETRATNPVRNGKTKVPGILLGCKSHKAVKVSGEAHKINGKVHHNSKLYRTSDSYVASATRFQPETRLKEYGLATSRSFTRSHPPTRASHLHYIQ